MTVEDLIQSVLRTIRTKFYADRLREYCRDERALTMAIARWGYTCERRGWDLEPDRIATHLQDLLRSVYQYRDQINYLPAYLDGAVRKWIGLHAEELQAEAQASQFKRTVDIVTTNLVRVAVVQPTTTETLDALFTALRKEQQRKRAATKAAGLAASRQQALAL